MLDQLQTFIAPKLRSVLKVLSIGPFHKKRIVFFSYFGAQYSCNPKYISEYMQAHYPEYDIFWAFNNPEQFRYLHKKNIKLVKYLSLPFLRTCLTSKYIITNSEIPSWFPVMKRQVYINTWHGGGAYKKVGASYNKETAGKQTRAALARRIPCTYISSSKAFSDLTIRQSFQHTGKILSCGMPRNDILVNQDHPELLQKIRTFYHLPEDSHILLYAPTYRASKAASDYAFDFRQVKAALEDRFGGSWFFLLRMHYFVLNQLGKSSEYIDASQYPDMQELLYASDILVTDYSSSMWDFALTNKPCFLYASDLDHYDLKRGFYSDIHSWPFPLAESGSELIQNIHSFNEETYLKDVRKHFTDLGSYETGHACEKTARYIVSGKL